MEKLGMALDLLHSQHVDNDAAGQLLFELAKNDWKL